MKWILNGHGVLSHDMPFIFISFHFISSLHFSSTISYFLFSWQIFSFSIFFSQYVFFCFLLEGSELSMVDIMFAPFLERMAASLPYYKGFLVRDKRYVRSVLYCDVLYYNYSIIIFFAVRYIIFFIPSINLYWYLTMNI